MATPTANYNILKPEVGGNTDDWGGITNDNWDKVDTLLLNRLIAQNPGDVAGTAATANKQTSPIDTTAGALMAVGAFGLGEKSLSVSSISNVNAVVVTGVFAFGNNSTGAPTANAGVVKVLAYRSDVIRQTAYSVDSASNETRIFTRNLYGNPLVAGEWHELFSTGNLVESGTWTPRWGNITDPLYDRQIGYYEKIGGICFLTARLTLSNKGTEVSASSPVTLNDIPFSVSARTQEFYTMNVAFSKNFSEAVQSMHTEVNQLVPKTFGGAGSNRDGVLRHADLTNTSDIIFSGYYKIG